MLALTSLNSHSSHSLNLTYVADGKLIVIVKPKIHFLDKDGHIFEPGIWTPGTAVTFDYDCVIPCNIPFNLRDHLDSLLHNGNLRIQVRLTYNAVAVSGLGRRMDHKHSITPPNNLNYDLSLFFENPSFFDVTICAGPETYQAHKVILAARSPVFRAMLEAPMIEAGSNCIKIDDFRPEIVKGMLKYLYSDDTSIVTPELAPEFIQIADFYGLDKLKFEAESVWAENLTMETAIEAFRQAIPFRLERLKSLAIDFIVRNDVLVDDSPELEEFVRAHLKEFIELVGDERMSGKVPQLIAILKKVIAA